MLSEATLKAHAGHHKDTPTQNTKFGLNTNPNKMRMFSIFTRMMQAAWKLLG